MYDTLLKQKYYGARPDMVRVVYVVAAIAAGLAGIGIEDTSGDSEHPIREFDDAVERVAQAAPGLWASMSWY